MVVTTASKIQKEQLHATFSIYQACHDALLSSPLAELDRQLANFLLPDVGRETQVFS